MRCLYAGPAFFAADSVSYFQVEEARVEKDLSSNVATMLHEAAEAHHVADAASDGVDPDWSLRYADKNDRPKPADSAGRLWAVPLLAVLGAVTAAAGALFACGEQAAAVRYGPEHANALSGRVALWNFVTDLVGGVPADSTVLHGEWVVMEQEGAPSPPKAVCGRGSQQPAAILLGDDIYHQLSYRVRLSPPSSRGAERAQGLLFHSQDADNAYLVVVESPRDTVTLYWLSSGRQSLLARSGAPQQLQHWQELRVDVTETRAEGQIFRVFVDGHQAFRMSHEALHAGRIGLWAHGGDTLCFDDVEAAP
jgi:hypothetical protein